MARAISYLATLEMIQNLGIFYHVLYFCIVAQGIVFQS